MSTSHPICRLDCIANRNAAFRLRLLAAAQAAEATYETRMPWGEYAERAGADDADLIECSDTLRGLDTCVCWATTRSQLIIAYRGTPATSVMAWARNLEATRTAWHPSRAATPHRVHQGFLAEYLATAFSLKNVIAHVGKGREIILIGHSKGGALAQYAAMDAVRNHPTLFTFGAPRCFNPRLSGIVTLCNDHYRVRHSNDLVPLMPGMGLLNSLRYRHSGELIMLTESGDIVRQPDLWARLKEAVCGYRLDAVADHFIGGYIEALASHGLE